MKMCMPGGLITTLTSNFLISFFYIHHYNFNYFVNKEHE